MNAPVAAGRRVLVTWVAALAIALAGASSAAASPFVYGSVYAFGQRELFKVDLATNTKSTVWLTGENHAGSLFFDAAGNIIYSAHTLSQVGQVHRFNPNTQVDEILISNLNNPKALILEPGGTTALVSEAGSGNLTRFTLCPLPPCTQTLVASNLGNWDGPHGLAYAGNRLYANIGNRVGQTSELAEIDPLTGAILQRTGWQGTLYGYTLDGLTYDGGGTNRLYGASVLGDLVYSFDPLNLSLAPVAHFVGQGLDGADGIIADGSGGLYVAAFGAGTLFHCIIASDFCTALVNIPGIDDLAPFSKPGGFNPRATDVGGSNGSTVPEPASLGLVAIAIGGAFARKLLRRA